MYSCADAATAVKRLLLAVGVVMLFAGGSVGAQSAGSKVEVMICPTPDQSQLAIDQPQSDSIVSESDLTLVGSVSFISQIDFFVDDVYNNTIALGGNDTSFTSNVLLRPGTHTIKLVATGSCGQVNREQSVVVTYQPKVQSSIGRDVATVVDEHASPSATARENPQISPPKKSPLEETVDTWVIAPIIDIGKSLDIVSLPAASAEMKWSNTNRSIFFVIGSAFTLTAGYITLLGAVPPRLSFLPYSRGQLIGGFAFSGIIILVLVFIL